MNQAANLQIFLLLHQGTITHNTKPKCEQQTQAINSLQSIRNRKETNITSSSRSRTLSGRYIYKDDFNSFITTYLILIREVYQTMIGHYQDDELWTYPKSLNEWHRLKVSSYYSNPLSFAQASSWSWIDHPCLGP